MPDLAKLEQYSARSDAHCIVTPSILSSIDKALMSISDPVKSIAASKKSAVSKLKITPKWSVQLKDGTRKLDLTLDEVLALSNGSVNPIVEINAEVSVGADLRKIEFQTSAVRPNFTVSFSITELDHKIANVKGQLQEVKSRMSAIKNSWMTYKLLWIIFASGISATIVHQLSEKVFLISIAPPILFIAGWVTADIIIRFFPVYFFPKWQCTIGDGQERYLSFNSRRSNFFWGIVVALVVSVAGSYAFKALNS